MTKSESGSSKCDTCGIGEKSDKGSAKCQVCEPGTFSNTAGESCKTCPGLQTSTLDQLLDQHSINTVDVQPNRCN